MQIGLLPERGDVTGRLPAVGEHQCEVDQDLAGIMTATAGPDPVHRARVLGAQPGPLRASSRSSRRPGARHDPGPVRGRHRPRASSTTLHAGSASLLLVLRPSASPESTARQALPAATRSRHAADHERPGLRPHSA